jgi:hypothetical protein
MNRPIWVALFAAGLAVRVIGLFHFGMVDVHSYVAWAKTLDLKGLAEAYSGTYFPLQWQIFQLCVALSEGGGLKIWQGIKLVSVGFELATFALLAHMLRRWRANPAWALLYWCHPWFLATSFLGYIDSQITFFSLLALLGAEAARGPRGFAIAGIPLGIAFVVKPQAVMLVAASAAYVGARGLLRRDWRAWPLLLGPCAAFAGYSLFFFAHGKPLLHLADSYLEAARHMPAISAQMLNVWYPLAYALAEGGSVVLVADANPVFDGLTARHVALALTLSCLVALVASLARRGEGAELEKDWLLLFTGASTIIPMLMTRVHEQHLYLATAFFALLLPMPMARLQRLSVHVLLAIQFLNVVGLYGLGRNRLTPPLKPFHELWIGPLSVAVALVASLCFFAILNLLFELAARERAGPRRGLPGALLLGALAVVYAVAFAAR